MPLPNPPKVERSWKRLDGVDVLRALAILFVIFSHVSVRLRLVKIPYFTVLPVQTVKALVGNGPSGVHIFFAVSGFLITSTALRRWGALKSVGIRDFYRLRFARIAPLFLTVLVVLSVLHAVGVAIFVVQPKTGGLGRALLAALTLHVGVLEARRGYLPPAWDVLWSLSVEELFYLFFPVVCRVLGQGRLLITLLFGFVAMGPFARTIWAHGNATWQEYTYLGGMDAIALGCLTALLVNRRTFSRRRLRSIGIIGAALLIYCLGFTLRANAWGLGQMGLYMTVVALGTCMVIVAASQSAWRCPSLFRPILTIGQRSYEIYLTHAFIVLGFFHIFLVSSRPEGSVL